MTIHPFHARDDHHRPGSAWRHLLDVAASEQDVVARLREFVASFTPYELEALPPELRPRKLVDASNVCGYAFELRRETMLRGDPPAILAAFADIFGYAAQRASQLLPARDDDDRETA